MKIDIKYLTYLEIQEIADRLKKLKLETALQKIGPNMVLQTEN